MELTANSPPNEHAYGPANINVCNEKMTRTASLREGFFASSCARLISPASTASTARVETLSWGDFSPSDFSAMTDGLSEPDRVTDSS